MICLFCGAEQEDVTGWEPASLGEWSWGCRQGMCTSRKLSEEGGSRYVESDVLMTRRSTVCPHRCLFVAAGREEAG